MSNGNGTTTIATRPSNEAYGQAGSAIARRTFGGGELESRRETQATQAAESAKALIQARYIMAERNPRDLDDVRTRILKHCDRPGFAQVAEYAKPVGGKSITGPSVRFVEAAIQEFGNVDVTSTPVYDDEEKRIVRVTVTDLERNITRTGDAVAEKFVERKRTKTGDEVIGERINSFGDVVYRVRATEDDFANKIGSAVSKMERQVGLKILPPDIVAESMARCAKTRADRDARDPDAARKAIADAFATIGVTPAALKEYLGHDLATCSPTEIDALRTVYVAIRDGEATWQATVDGKLADAPAEKPADKVGDALKAKLATAPAGDKAPSSKPRSAGAIEVRRKALFAAIQWSSNGERQVGACEDIEIAIEQVGPETWGWWIMKGGEDASRGEAPREAEAKAAAIAEAAKL